MIDVAPVPDGLENSIAEAEHHQVLYGFFSEIMIDAVNLAFIEHLFDLGIQGTRGLEIVLGDLARLQERQLEGHRLGLHMRVDGASRIEVHDTFVVAQLRRHAQHARFPAQVEQLEDIVDA